MQPEIKDHIALIRIDHPPANAWDLTTMQAFGRAVDQVKSDPAVRVVIITGAGEKFFSAGFDVSDAANTEAISNLGRDLWRQIDRFPKPTIAAINGYALGGGLELALACHFRLLADNPKLKVGLTELNLGIIPGWGGTQRLPRLVGRAKALDMILYSRTLSAREAFTCGLVDRLIPPDQLIDDAMDMARRLAARPPVAVRCVLDAFATGLYEGLDPGLMCEAQGAATVRQTEDRKEGFAAFKEKRKPNFVGR
ncbi:enoyl-CoA hydratase-related protein [Desulfosarcina variabilis]|uniref:enoyl-CoA hydratase-related protein n=1 Tax=Desulfosarcina variabilis TaxID=2300 RepID=UPI003AFB6105